MFDENVGKKGVMFVHPKLHGGYAYGVIDDDCGWAGDCYWTIEAIPYGA